MFLPIQFKTRYNKAELKGLDASKILELTEIYLKNKGFEYLKSENNKLTFHYFNFKKFKPLFTIGNRFILVLMSGIVYIEENEKTITITNGNWLVMWTLLPFLCLPFFIYGKESQQLFISMFGSIIYFLINFLIRFFAHLSLKKTIKQIINGLIYN